MVEFACPQRGGFATSLVAFWSLLLFALFAAACEGSLYSPGYNTSASNPYANSRNEEWDRITDILGTQSAGHPSTISYWQGHIQDDQESNVSMSIMIYNIIDINTHAKTLSVQGSISLGWTATNLACAPAHSYNYSTYEQGTCQDPGQACFLHPPLVTAADWARDTHRAQKGSLIPCTLAQENQYIINAFRDQVWHPTWILRDEIVLNLKRIGDFIWATLPNPANDDRECAYVEHSSAFGDATAGTKPRLFSLENFISTTKVKMNLDKFPFDEQALKLWVDPPSRQSYRQNKFHNGFYDCGVTRLITENGVVKTHHLEVDGSFGSSTLVDTVVSGWTIIGVDQHCVPSEIIRVHTDQDADQKPHISCFFELRVRRVWQSVFLRYMLPSIIIWTCSYLLFYIQEGSAPGIAGAVVATTILMIIINGLLTGVYSLLPYGSDTTYLTAVLLGTMGIMLLQLCIHLRRMAFIQEKKGTWLVFTTIFARAFFPILFIVMHASLLAGFEISWVSALVLCLLAALLSLRCVYLLAKECRQLEAEGESITQELVDDLDVTHSSMSKSKDSHTEPQRRTVAPKAQVEAEGQCPFEFEAKQTV